MLTYNVESTYTTTISLTGSISVLSPYAQVLNNVMYGSFFYYAGADATPITLTGGTYNGQLSSNYA